MKTFVIAVIIAAMLLELAMGIILVRAGGEADRIGRRKFCEEQERSAGKERLDESDPVL